MTVEVISKCLWLESRWVAVWALKSHEVELCKRNHRLKITYTEENSVFENICLVSVYCIHEHAPVISNQIADVQVGKTKIHKSLYQGRIQKFLKSTGASEGQGTQ